MRKDDGSAAIEFLLLTLLLFIPIIYLVLTVFALQGASFAASGAARDAARVVATAGDYATAMRTVETSTALAFDDFSIDADPSISVTCESGCAEPGAIVRVTVSATVPLPLVPSFLADRAAIPVTAHAASVVDRFRERP